MSATELPIPAQRRRGVLADDVAVYIRDLILTGQLRPGSKIDQDAVSRVLDVSRSPIREALVVLGQEGLIEVSPHRGAFVANLTPDHIIDHYELYGVVSGRAAAMAADNLKEEDLDALEQIHKRFVEGTDADLSVLNDEFHRIINRAAPPRTRWLLRHLVRSVPSAYYEFADGWDEHAVTGHQEIMTAILDRDPEAARAAMEAHLHASGEVAVAALRAVGFWSDDG